MIINLVGLLDDGTPRVEGQSPINPRTRITIPRGADATIRFTAKTPIGADVPLGAPNSLVLTVKKRAQDSKIFSRAPTIVGGVAEFAITPADMKQQDPGYYVYDIWHTDGAGKQNPVMPLSPLYLEAASHDPVVLPAVDPNLVALWTMEDIASFPTVTDFAKGLNPLASVGWPPSAPVVVIPPMAVGRVGRFSRYFEPNWLDAGQLQSAASGAISSTQRALFQGAYSVACWVNPYTIPAGFASGSGDFSTLLAITAPGSNTDAALFWFSIRSQYKQITVGWGGGFVDIGYTEVLTENAWNHVAVTYTPDENGPDDGSFRLYINGVLVKTETGWPRAPDQPTARWQLGGLPDVDASGIHSSGGFPFYGQIDEMRVYSKALTDAEVLALASV